MGIMYTRCDLSGEHLFMEYCGCLAAGQYLVQLQARTQAVAIYYFITLIRLFPAETWSCSQPLDRDEPIVFWFHTWMPPDQMPEPAHASPLDVEE